MLETRARLGRCSHAEVVELDLDNEDSRHPGLAWSSPRSTRLDMHTPLLTVMTVWFLSHHFGVLEKPTIAFV